MSEYKHIKVVMTGKKKEEFESFAKNYSIMNKSEFIRNAIEEAMERTKNPSEYSNDSGPELINCCYN